MEPQHEVLSVSKQQKWVLGWMFREVQLAWQLGKGVDDQT